MYLTAKVKLITNTEQYNLLKLTTQRANACCDYISNIAWEARRFGQFGLHKIVYKDARSAFPELSSQVVIRCEAKVSQAYAIDKKVKRSFRPLGAIEYDARLLTWYVNKREVSIWACGGRLRLNFQCGSRQLELLQGKIGQADLVLIDGIFYLFASCWVEEGCLIDVKGVLGIDMGIANIAVSSDGDIFQGKSMKGVRYRQRQLRQKLQAKGTKSSHRLLKKLSGKERRFATWVNHNISKRIVEIAKGTNRSIAIEDLGGIRARVTARRSQRAALHSWSFFQLRTFLEYKSELAGVPIVAVDPRNTSRLCPECGHIAKSNRKSQSVFLCVVCGYSQNADYVASVNISRRGVVNHPCDSTIPKFSELRQGQDSRL